jgi:hypothetical protein
MSFSGQCFSGNHNVTPVGGIEHFTKRKTGQYRAVWIEDLLPPLSAG